MDMKFKFGSFYRSASHKDNSEDFVSYAPSREGLLLTDGCSSSNGDVILGSRFFHRLYLENPDASLLDLIREIKGSRGLLKDEDLLFTSLSLELFGSGENGIVHVNFLGDGTLVCLKEDGVDLWSKEYNDNTPLYVGYSGNTLVPCLSYEDQYESDGMNLFESVTLNPVKLDKNKNSYDSFSVQMRNVQKLVFFSDGIDQVYTKENQHVPKSEIIDYLIKNQNDTDRHSSSSVLSRKIKLFLKDKVLGDDFSFISIEKYQ